MAENVLYYGDNLDILRRYIKDEIVDTAYKCLYKQLILYLEKRKRFGNARLFSSAF